MPSPPLSHFPDLCLLAIFKHIPLTHLIRHIGLVCPNWARVQQDELKRRQNTTKHLVIVQDFSFIEYVLQQDDQYGSDLIEKVLRDDGTPWAQLPNPNDSILNTIGVPGRVLTESFTTPLMNLLPNITHLNIFQNNIIATEPVISALEQIVVLINHYATKLVSLKVHFSNYSFGQIEIDNNVESSMLALFDAINRLKSLRHLKLHIDFGNLQFGQSRLSILSRLTTFTAHAFEPVSLLLASLREHVTTGDVRVDCDISLGSILREMIQFDPQLATRFIRASISNAHVSAFNNIRQFCTRLDSLTTLGLSGSMPMTMISRCLSLLPKLISLNISFMGPIPEEERTPHLEIAQLPTVRLLTLNFSTNSHLDTERLHLHQIFPNLQVLHLIHSSLQCTECEYQFGHSFEMPHRLSNDPEMATRISHCMSLARQPIRQCASLHTIRLRTCLDLEFMVPQELITLDQL